MNTDNEIYRRIHFAVMAIVSEHIKHIFEDGEPDENSVVRKFRTTAA